MAGRRKNGVPATVWGSKRGREKFAKGGVVELEDALDLFDVSVVLEFQDFGCIDSLAGREHRQTVTAEILPTDAKSDGVHFVVGDENLVAKAFGNLTEGFGVSCDCLKIVSGVAEEFLAVGNRAET